MPQTTVKRLLESLEELERSVGLSKKAFSSIKPVNQALLERISYYEEILAKQKKLTAALLDHMNNENWLEVNRHVKLINGLSTLINDDARGLVEQIVNGKELSTKTELPR